MAAKTFAQIGKEEPKCPRGSQACIKGFLPGGPVVGEEVCIEFVPLKDKPNQWKATCEKAKNGAMAKLEEAVRDAAKRFCALGLCIGQARCVYHVHRLVRVQCKVERRERVELDPNNPRKKIKRIFCCARCSARVWVLCCCLP